MYYCQNKNHTYHILVRSVLGWYADLDNIFTEISISNVPGYILAIIHCDTDYYTWRVVAFITTMCGLKYVFEITKKRIECISFCPALYETLNIVTPTIAMNLYNNPHII